jgi:hypothetical protein
MRIPRWLDYLIMAFTVFTAAAVCVALLVPVLVANWLRSHTRRAKAARLDFAHRLPSGDRIPLRDGAPDYVQRIRQEWTSGRRP